MLAAQQLQFRGGHVAGLLLTHPHIDVTAANDNLARTALHYAAEYGGLDLVKACVSMQPDMLNVRDDVEQTPAMMAAARGHVHVVDFLLHQSLLDSSAVDWQGAQPCARTRCICTPSRQSSLLVFAVCCSMDIKRGPSSWWSRGQSKVNGIFQDEAAASGVL
jgi:hypothetical protein